MPRPAEASCPTVRDRLDPLLDGDLTSAEEALLRSHLDGCPACREELRLARDLRRAIRGGLPTLECPPEVSARVLAIARSEAGQGGAAHADARMTLTERLRSWLSGGGLGHLRPASTLAAVAALLLLLMAVPLALREAFSPGPGPTAPAVATGNAPEYTAEEIAQAEQQARLVLAAVAEVGRGAGRTVRDEVFEEALGQPARRVLESLQGGMTVPRASERPIEADGSGRRP